MATDHRTATRHRFGLEHDGLEVSEADYLDAQFDEPWRYELVEGRLSVLSPNSEEHCDAEEFWIDLLIPYKLANRNRVQKVVPEAWVRIKGKTYRIGDLGVYLVGERSAIRRPTRAPELMFEFLSPGKDAHDRDYLQKRADYHAVEVWEYVVVDPEARTVLVLSHQPEGYHEAALSVEDTYTTPLLPGFAVALAEVLPE